MSQTVANANEDVPPAAAATSRDRHPAGLYILFATEMWERFGFYTAAAIMTLYLQRGGFGWSKTQATEPLVELPDVRLRHAADRRLAGRQVPGLSPLGAAGRGVLHRGLRDARARVARDLLHRPGPDLRGNGFFKPNISTMVGNLYPAGSPLKDSAYNIFYMGINIGALLAPIVAEALLQTFAGPEVLEMAKKGTTLTAEQAASLRSGFLAAFFAAAGGMTLGTVIFAVFYRKLAGGRAEARPARTRRRGGSRSTEDVAPLVEKLAPSSRCPSRTRIVALLVIFGIVDRLLDGLPPERQHDDLLGRREHRLEGLGRDLQRDQPVLDRRAVAPPGAVLGLAAQAGAGAVHADEDGDRHAADQPGLPDPVRRGQVGRRPDVPHRAQGQFLLDDHGEFKVDQHRVSPIWLISPTW